MSDSLQPYGLPPARFVCPWDSPGKNTRVDCQCPPPGDLPDPEIEPQSLVSPALQADSLPTEPPGKPIPPRDPLPALWSVWSSESYFAIQSHLPSNSGQTT